MSTSTPSGGRSGGWAVDRSVARTSRQRVHVEHAVHLQHPIEIVSAALLEAPAKWFPNAVGVHMAGIPVRKKVAIDFGDASGKLLAAGFLDVEFQRLKQCVIRTPIELALAEIS